MMTHKAEYRATARDLLEMIVKEDWIHTEKPVLAGHIQKSLEGLEKQSIQLVREVVELNNSLFNYMCLKYVIDFYYLSGMRLLLTSLSKRKCLKRSLTIWKKKITLFRLPRNFYLRFFSFCQSVFIMLYHVILARRPPP